MPSGTWAFLQESVIYEYMMHRFYQNNLLLKPVIINGNPELKERWIRVDDMDSIKDTFFPDVKRLKIKGDTKGNRPAEIKYLTSLFDYHKSKKHEDKYKQFICKMDVLLYLSMTIYQMT